MFAIDHDVMIFLSYTLPKEAEPRGYEKWLREVDNPFFNAIPGVKRYENWKIMEAHGSVLAFTHFDFLYLQSEADLERVWFNQDLDNFRKGWIAKWGYGDTGRMPSQVNAYGYLTRREGPPAVTKGTWLAMSTDATIGEAWRIAERVRKHYAIGPVPAGQPWHHLEAIPVPHLILRHLGGNWRSRTHRCPDRPCRSQAPRRSLRPRGSLPRMLR